MQKISINLLPEEVLLQRKQSTKLSLINKLSAAVIAVLIFAVSATLSLRIIQSSKLSLANKNLAYAKSRVTAVQGKEAQIILLKQRLASIRKLSDQGQKEQAMFNLLLLDSPPDLSISSITIDQDGNSSIEVSSSSLDSINNFLETLSDPTKNAGLISKISTDGLSEGQGSTYLFTLKITAK